MFTNGSIDSIVQSEDGTVWDCEFSFAEKWSTGSADKPSSIEYAAKGILRVTPGKNGPDVLLRIESTSPDGTSTVVHSTRKSVSGCLKFIASPLPSGWDHNTLKDLSGLLYKAVYNENAARQAARQAS